MTKSKELIPEAFFDRLYQGELRDRIIVTPILDKRQINAGVIDLRLGTEFILTKKTEFSSLDIIESELSNTIKKYQEKITVNFKDGLILHPNQFIIGSTLEYIKLPNDIIGYIIGRSSWGRLGLVIATATLINPGFAGVITLELTNVGEVPIKLYPILRIAQISFHRLDFYKGKNGPKSRKYFGSTSPSFSEIYKDYDKCLIEEEIEEVKFIKKIIKSLISMIEDNSEVDFQVLYNNIRERIQKYKTHLNLELHKDISKIDNYLKDLKNQKENDIF